MKQSTLFDSQAGKEEQKYSSKIEAPIYEPKNIQPAIYELCDKSVTERLIRKIEKSNVSDSEKEFLLNAATRHSVFNYEKVADYYSHASKEMQDLMEQSALVIIDFEKAIELGYVKLCDQIKTQYLEEYDQQ